MKALMRNTLIVATAAAIPAFFRIGDALEQRRQERFLSQLNGMCAALDVRPEYDMTQRLYRVASEYGLGAREALALRAIRELLKNSENDMEAITGIVMNEEDVYRALMKHWPVLSRSATEQDVYARFLLFARQAENEADPMRQKKRLSDIEGEFAIVSAFRALDNASRDGLYAAIVSQAFP